MPRPTLVPEDELRRLREAVRFGGVSYRKAAAGSPYADYTALYNAIVRYEARHNLKPTDRQAEEGGGVGIEILPPSGDETADTQ